ncbi:glycosyltransferase family 4 protein (plasmid) [Thalassobaculum sp. OXR-137]|uniref:glycosyltransferase family 4 protein n=1 Tax=Thalassobaculum sp. OXR-137 TaxID=3100173 RepID=UPI002AC9F06E|nr:glycosyltransferase family 4 protein [Thalassobaculum sp. OXR-137]WPZ37245.1 glycosyltransferase family 4 protein [Thalassobaculum sp. OXR-137]
MTGAPTRVAFLITHPIQYAAPLFRRIAGTPGLDLTVLYGSDLSSRGYYDPGFGREVAWDVDLLDGYRSVFLPTVGRTDVVDLWRPFVRGVGAALKEARSDWLVIHGYSRPSHLLAVLAARRAGVRVLIRDEATAISRDRGPAKRVFKRAFFAALDRLVDGYLAIGTLNAAYYRAMGIPYAKLFLMPYAVDNGYFRAAAETREQTRSQLGLAPGTPVVLCAAKLQPRKNPDRLIAAFRRLETPAGSPAPQLLLAGDGEMRDALVRQAAGDANIHFLGFQGQQDLVRLYAACDVFVLPSQYEPWGLVVNEAMSAGRAVVVSDRVGSAPDLVRQGENGFVYPVDDVPALTRALAKVCFTPGLAGAMGERSREIVAQWDIDADVRGLVRAVGLPARE